MGKSSFLPRHRLTYFSSVCCRVEAFLAQSCSDFSTTGVRQWLFPPGRVGARGTHAGSANWEGAECGVGLAAGRTAARLSGTSPPSLPPPFFLPERAPPEPALRARIRCPFPVPSVAARFLSSSGCWAGGSAGPRDPLHPTSCQGDLSHCGNCLHPGARRCGACSLWGRFYNLHGNLYLLGRAHSLIG